MRYQYLIKALLCLLPLILLCSLPAAEYRNGQLYLEVLLSSGTQISLETSGSAQAELTVSEQASPISRLLRGNLNISLTNADKLAFWGLLSRVEPWADHSDGVLREYFAWEDSTLVIKRENLIFEGITFAGIEGARKYARETGIPENQIQNIPLINSTVRVKTTGGPEYYFETPLLIHSATPLFIGGVKLGYSGDFILKTINGKMVLTHFLPLEEYIAGVIQNEIGSTAPLEALKTQAVAARTHAVSLLLYNRHKNDGYDLCNSTHCQVYKGEHLLNESILEAVSATRGEVLLAGDRIADATYHSSCGGKTDSSENIWNGSPLPHLMGVTCIEAAESIDLSKENQARRWIETNTSTQGMSSWEKASVSWQKSISRQALARNVGLSSISRIVINKRGSSGRITDMSFHGSGTVRLTSEYKIRQAFGSAKSSFFYIRGAYSMDKNGGVSITPPATVSIKGKGSGHGVGMCQVGTLDRARNGATYRDILSHYYPETRICSDWMGHAR
ncbi:MAG: SpoIID/LytB domain-containing protein [Candidatus Syntrophosphaera sp.]|nr:SpoIID/LytB domain-containing protein [Candidatus Syntrophosphaera sp.]